MERQSICVHEQEKSMTVEQMKRSLDSMIQKLDENIKLLSDMQFIKEIVQFITNSKEKYFSETSIINHRIFVILRDYYLNLLQRWRDGENLDDTFTFIFEAISNIFMKMSNYIFDNNASVLKELIFHDSLLHQINTFLEELSLNKKYFYDPQMKSLDNLFKTIQRLERISFDNRKDNFYDNIIKCICSSSFIEIFLQSINEENENPGENFLLITLPDYIHSHSIDKQHKESLMLIRQTLLQPFSQWLTEKSSFFRLWNNRTLIIVRQISFLLTLSIQLNRFLILDKDTLNSYCQIIDSFINILYSIIQSDNLINRKIIGILTPNLYTMTLSNQLEKYFQNKHITLLILKLAYFQNDEIQLNAFQILSAITTEQDTKNIIYSNSITSLFIKILNEIIDDLNQPLTIYNLLRCLKNFVQFDQIKDELTKENGLILIIRCATETKFKPLQVQQPALEILLALTFNKQAYEQLKLYLNQLKPFLSSSHQGISRAVQTILWKLENEEEILAKPKVYERDYKYDIFLSFSHSDKDLCLRIYEQLLKDNFRVYIDHDETFPTTMNEKCELIDECEYFVVCISNKYKENSYCRCEASYAFERQYQIIPLIVKSNYRPDGWLHRIVSGKISIDFIKLDFDFAEKKLKNEIDRQRKYTKINQQKDLILITTNESSSRSERPTEIDQWTNDDVKFFLISINLNAVLPICNEMNGKLLHQLYRMCLSNRESMFHTLQKEISTFNSNNQTLTLLNYLRFLNEIEKYIPTFVINQKE